MRRRLAIGLFLCAGLSGCSGGAGGSRPAPAILSSSGSSSETTLRQHPQDAGSAALAPKAPAISFNDYVTFGYDNQRDVYNPNSTAITPASMPKLHLAWQGLMNGGDFNVQSQPVLATEIPSHTGVLYVAGGFSGYVDAFDALTGAFLWKTATGQELYSCDPANDQAYFGIGGSVAYDPSSRSLYVVGNKNSTLDGYAQNLVIHLDGASGTLLGKVDVDAGELGQGELNFGHTSVTLADGLAYVGTGSTCDLPAWRGRIAAVNVPAMTVAHTFYTVWNKTTEWDGGGVWGWGGVSLDFNGNVLTGVGNTDNGTNGTIPPPFEAAPQEFSGNGEALMELSSDLTKVAENHPIPQSVYGGNSVDLDVNGTPAVFKPMGTGCDTMAALQAKSGALYIYDTTRIARGPAAEYQLAPSSYADGFLGDPAYSKATGLLYAPVASSVSPNLYPPGMIAINPGCGAPAYLWNAVFGPDSTGNGIPRSVPAPSAGGVVFIATACNALSGRCPVTGPYGALWEIDASKGTVLNNGSPVLYTNSVVRAPATIDGKWVFVVDTGGDLYGLTIDPKYPAIAAKRRAIDPRMLFNRKTARPRP